MKVSLGNVVLFSFLMIMLQKKAVFSFAPFFLLVFVKMIGGYRLSCVSSSCRLRRVFWWSLWAVAFMRRQGRIVLSTQRPRKHGKYFECDEENKKNGRHQQPTLTSNSSSQWKVKREQEQKPHDVVCGGVLWCFFFLLLLRSSLPPIVAQYH